MPACTLAWCALPPGHEEDHDIPGGLIAVFDRPASVTDPARDVAIAQDGSRWHIWNRNVWQAPCDQAPGETGSSWS